MTLKKRNIRARKLYFDGRKPGRFGADIKAGVGWCCISGGSGMSGPWIFLHQGWSAGTPRTASAACLAAPPPAGSPEAVTAVLNRFEGLAHQVQYAGSVCGVEFFDDSKATTVDSVKRALECFRQTGYSDHGDWPRVAIFRGFGAGAEKLQKNYRHRRGR